MLDDNSKKNTIHSDINYDMYEELMKIAETDPILKQAFDAWEELSMSEQHKAAYNERLKQLYDEENNK